MIVFKLQTLPLARKIKRPLDSHYRAANSSARLLRLILIEMTAMRTGVNFEY